MTRTKNLCQKCGVRQGASTGKKCARGEEIPEIVSELQVGTVSNENGLQAHPPVGSKTAVIADHPCLAVEERVEAVEGSVSEMKEMMKVELEAVKGKDKKEALTDSTVVVSTDDEADSSQQAPFQRPFIVVIIFGLDEP